MNILRVYDKTLSNLYCEIFGTGSYDRQALASLCVLRHMNLCRIFHNTNSITYNYCKYMYIENYDLNYPKLNQLIE